MAGLVIEAIQSTLPLRRCSTRLGANYVPPSGATPCSPAQLGVTQCPCAGMTDRTPYDAAVATAARVFNGEPGAIRLHLAARMADLAAAQRYEEAALVRDRLSALLTAVRRQQLLAALLASDRCTVRRGGVSWVVDQGRLVDVTISGEVGRSLPVDPPEPPRVGRPLHRQQVDEALCLAKYFDRHASRLDVVTCSGSWLFPLEAPTEMPRLDAQPVPVGVSACPPASSRPATSSTTTAPS